MIQKVIPVQDRMVLRVCRTDQFKAETLSLSAVLPIGEDAYLTSLLLAVLLRGSARYPTVAAINRRLDDLYGTEISLRNHYLGGSHVIGLCADVVGPEYQKLEVGEESALEGALEMMRELLFHPLLDANGLLSAHYVESEKRLQCDSIRAQKNNPSAYAAERCHALAWKDSPMGQPILGDEERVMAVTPLRLTEHWRTLLQRLSLEFFYVGAEDGDVIAAALKKTFLGELSGKSFQNAASVCCRLPDAPAARGEESLPITQSHLVILYDTGVTLCDRDFYATSLFNEILGASPVSKLFMNVRERLGLCYSCHSAYNAYRGTLRVSCGLSDASMERAEREIEAALRSIADGNVSESEWISAKKSLVGAYRQMKDSPVALERFFFGRAQAGVSVTPEECCRALEDVTLEDVVRVANRVRHVCAFSLHATGSEEVDSFEED